MCQIRRELLFCFCLMSSMENVGKNRTSLKFGGRRIAARSPQILSDYVTSFLRGHKSFLQTIFHCLGFWVEMAAVRPTTKACSGHGKSLQSWGSNEAWQRDHRNHTLLEEPQELALYYTMPVDTCMTAAIILILFFLPAADFLPGVNYGG